MHTRGHEHNLLGFGKYLKQKRVATRAFCGFFGVMLLAGLAIADPMQITPQQLALYKIATENQRVHILITLAKSGQPQMADDLLHQFPLEGPHAANRTLFVDGLIRESKGDLTGAAREFRSALADDPKLTLVRSELAQVLFALNENDSAKHHLQLLEGDAPDPQSAKGIRAFIDKIDESRPYTVSGYVSFAPSTNINGGSAHSTVYSPPLNINMTIANQKKSGVGLAGGLNVGYSHRLGNKFQAVLGAGIDGAAYLDSKFDSVSTSEIGEMRYLLENGYLSLGAVASQAYDPLRLDLNFHSYGPRVGASYQITQRDLLNTNAFYEWRDYGIGQPLNGTSFESNLAVTHALDSTSNFTIFGGYDRGNTTNSWTSNSSYFGGVNIYKELPMGITIDANLQTRFTYFDGIENFTDILRRDQRYIASATFTKRDLNILGFAPSLQYSYTLNSSNNPLYDYDAHAVDFRLTKDF